LPASVNPICPQRGCRIILRREPVACMLLSLRLPFLGKAVH
jgi:hypothetical protein